MRARGAIPLLLTLLLAGCAGGTLVRGGGDGIRAAQALNAEARPRVIVGIVLDKTGGALTQALSQFNAGRAAEEQVAAADLTRGIRDMLTTSLFGSGQFIVLERDALDVALAEQEFSQSARTGDKTRIPLKQLEGADRLVVAALTAFDTDRGGAIPIPIPLGRNNGFAVINVGARRGYVTMDLRVIEVKTGRILSSTAVEGSHWRWGLDVGGYLNTRYRLVKLPKGLINLFSNTPVEQALQDMVVQAVDVIARPPAE